MDNRAKIDELTLRTVEALGCELVEADLFQAGSRAILRIFVDKDGGVGLEDCARISRELGAAIDLEDLIPNAYHLEVSSPGLDRPLKTTREFQRNMGRDLRLGLSEPLNGRNQVIAKLVGVDEENLTLEGPDGEQITLPRAQVLQAKVELIF